VAIVADVIIVPDPVLVSAPSNGVPWFTLEKVVTDTQLFSEDEKSTSTVALPGSSPVARPYTATRGGVDELPAESINVIAVPPNVGVLPAPGPLTVAPVSVCTDTTVNVLMPEPASCEKS